MSNAAHRHEDDRPHGAHLLPRDLTEQELEHAPVLPALDALIIEELTADEDEAFAAALRS